MNTPKRTDSKVRAEVRKRMAATGEKYTTALAAITNPPVELPPFLPSEGGFFVTDEEFGPDSLPLRITWGADRRAQILAAAGQSPTTAFIVTKRPAEYPTGVLAADEIPSAALLERMDAILLDGYAQIVDDPHRRLELESVLRHARANNMLVTIYVDDDDTVPDGAVDRALARLALTGDVNSLVATSLSSELVLGVDAHGAQVAFAGHLLVLDPDVKLSPPLLDDLAGQALANGWEVVDLRPEAKPADDQFDYVADELTRRNRLLAEHGASQLEELPRGIRPPRLLVLSDGSERGMAGRPDSEVKRNELKLLFRAQREVGGNWAVSRVMGQGRSAGMNVAVGVPSVTLSTSRWVRGQVNASKLIVSGADKINRYAVFSSIEAISQELPAGSEGVFESSDGPVRVIERLVGLRG